MKSVLKHIVLFQFKDNADQASIEKVIQAFLDLKERIPFIQSIEWGTDVSSENLNQGFTHLFCLTFENSKKRDEYLPHPAHQGFIKLTDTVVEKVFVFDYNVK